MTKHERKPCPLRENGAHVYSLEGRCACGWVSDEVGDGGRPPDVYESPTGRLNVATTPALWNIRPSDGPPWGPPSFLEAVQNLKKWQRQADAKYLAEWKLAFGDASTFIAQEQAAHTAFEVFLRESQVCGCGTKLDIPPLKPNESIEATCPGCGAQFIYEI